MDNKLLNDIFALITKQFEEKFSTEYRRLKSFEETNYFIKSKDYIIGDELKYVLSENRIIQNRAAVKAQFVPTREILKQFFSIDGDLDET